MLRHGKRYRPKLLGAEVGQQQTPGVASVSAQYEFTVTVNYINASGDDALWNGSFYSSDRFAAEALGRDFVIKYLQPQAITDASALPIGFELTEPPPRVLGSMAATEEGGDTCAVEGMLARMGGMAASESGGDTSLVLGVLGNAGAEMLPGEADGFGVDFMETINFNVAVRTNSVTAAYGLDFITSTGSEPKMVFDAAGVLGYSPHNMAAWSEQLDMYPSAAGAANCLVTPDVDTWPGGGMTADRMFAGNTTELYKYRATSIAVPLVVGQVYTLTRLFKRDNWDFVFVQFPGPGDLTIFNLASGATTPPASGATVTAVADNLGGGWWRLKLTAVATATAAYASPGMASAIDNPTFTGSTGVESVIVGPVQLNRGSKPCAYVPTAATARFLLPQAYDPVTHAPLGVLCEPAATNSLLWSTDFSNVIWEKYGTFTANAITAPNGLLEGSKIADNGDGFVTITQNWSGGVTGNASVFAKAGEFSQISIGSMAAATVDGFDLVTGTTFVVKYNGVAQPSTGTATMQDCGNGWWRCSSYVTSLPDFATGPTVDQDYIFTPQVGSGVYFWGPQLAANPGYPVFPAFSYIPTRGAAVTRVADDYRVAAAAINHSSAAGTWYAEARLLGGLANERIIGTPSSPGFITTATDRVEAYDTTLLTKAITLNTSNMGTGFLHKFSCAIAAGGEKAVTANGLPPVVDMGGSAGLLSTGTINFGSGGGTTMIGYLCRAAYVPRRISDDAMQIQTGGSGPFGGAALLSAETQGVGIDFTHPTENAIAVKTP